ncbi:hypothetical protein D3C75_1268010 [compost metagenome]
MCIVLGMCWIDGTNSKIVSSVMNSKSGLAYRMSRYAENAITDFGSNFGRIFIILSDMDSIRIDPQSKIHIIINDEGNSCGST